MFDWLIATVTRGVQIVCGKVLSLLYLLKLSVKLRYYEDRDIPYSICNFHICNQFLTVNIYEAGIVTNTWYVYFPLKVDSRGRKLCFHTVLVFLFIYYRIRCANVTIYIGGY